MDTKWEEIYQDASQVPTREGHYPTLYKLNSLQRTPFIKVTNAGQFPEVFGLNVSLTFLGTTPLVLSHNRDGNSSHCIGCLKEVFSFYPRVNGIHANRSP